MAQFSEDTSPKTVIGDGDSVVLPAQPEDVINGPDARPELYDASTRIILIDGNTPVSTEIEQLRERNRYLETVVQEQNKALLSYVSVKRTYEATLRILETTKMENEVLQNDRDKYYNENEFNKQKAEEMFQKLEHCKERITELNFCLVQFKQEADEKIVGLENEVDRWKRKYENDVAIPKREGVAQTGPPRTGLLSRELSSPIEQVIEFRGIQEVVKSPERKRKCSFHKMKTRLPWCKNCDTIFDTLKPHQVDCRFHRCFPQPLKIEFPPYVEKLPAPCGRAWQYNSVLKDKKVPGISTQPYKFWPCCEKTSIREPPGCLKLKQHDVIYPEYEEID